MNGLIAWWARNTVAANLLMIGILIAGLMAYSQMERELDPKINFNGISIQATWPGAGPEEIKEQIVERIEQAVSDLDNIKRLNSISRQGSGTVWIRAGETVDFTSFQNDVTQRINSIGTFPSRMEPIRIERWTNNQQYMRLALSGNIPEKELKNLADKIRREVLALNYISQVSLSGTRQEEISIEVSPDALQRYGITFQDVSNAISKNSLNLSSGAIRTSAGNTGLAFRALADDEESLNQLVVRQTIDGGTIRIKDIATVRDGFIDDELLATVKGVPTVLINIINGETMQILKATQNVRDYIEKREVTLPEGVTLDIWEDQSIAFANNLNLLSGSALIGLMMVMVILFLTLRPIVAFWVTIGIATAYLGAFIFLPTIGISINFISMFSFLLVLGVVVDDAIIVGENIHNESKKSGGGITGAILGTQLVSKPVIFGVLTTIIAFLPWIFLEGEASDFTRNITWVVVCALVFSLIEALFILPAHLSKMKPIKEAGFLATKQKAIAEGIVQFAERYYRPVAEWASDQRWFIITGMIGIYVIFHIGLFGSGYIGWQFNPDIESEQITINITLPEGTPYSRAEQVLGQIQDAQSRLEAETTSSLSSVKSSSDPGITSTDTPGTISQPSLIENWFTEARPERINAVIKLTRNELRPFDADGLPYTAKDIAIRFRELMGDIPDATEVEVRYQRNEPQPGIQLAIGHPDTQALTAAAEDLMQQLRSYPAVISVQSDTQPASNEAQFTLLPGAEKLGLTLQDISAQVRQAYFGAEPMRLARDGSDVPIRIKYPRSVREDPESLKEFQIRTPGGEWIPLVAVVDITYAPGIGQILNLDRKQTAIISVELNDNKSKEINADLTKNFWDDWEARHPGAYRRLVGQNQGQQEFFVQLTSLYTIAFFTMYAMLAIAFRSYAQPIMIMTAIPFAYIGALIGHWLTGTPMTFFSFFGIAAAAGVVVNDNLVMVDYCNKLRNDHNMDPKKSMVEAGVRRFRPILLTTVTTVVGLIPMLLDRSQEAAFLKPMVIALAAGVSFDFFVTLLLVPALYRAGGDIKIIFKAYIRWQFLNHWDWLTQKNKKNSINQSAGE